MPSYNLREHLDRIYSRYNRLEYLHPDPLEFLWRYNLADDREIVGLVASGLAYGRVTQILKSIERILHVLGPSPSEYLRNLSPGELERKLSGFKHRFTIASEMVALLKSVSILQEKWGLLENMFEAFLSDHSYHDALEMFVTGILEEAGINRSSLLPRPSLGSACKRLHLFMRWMVRSDKVDPGGWTNISPSILMVPLDVHMFRVAQFLGFTERKNTTYKTALEITEGFRRINPDDPVKYDFALTRMGIQGLHNETLFNDLFHDQAAPST